MSDESATRRDGFLEHGAYRLGRQVRWGECDMAGIGYTPRFFDWMVTSIEQFFREVLQSPWETLRTRGLASPFAGMSLDFRAPVRVGERMELTLRVGNIGRTSVSWLITGCVAERECFTGAATTVFVATANDAPTRIPDDLLLLLRRRPSSRSARDSTQ